MPYKILINGEPIYADTYPFTWGMRPGVRSYPGQFRVSGTRQGKFWPPTNPVTLEWEVSTGGANSRSESITWENLYITEYGIGESINQKTEFAFQVRDLRWKWAGRLIHGRFNHPRRLNDMDIKRAGDRIALPGQAVIEPEGGFAPVEPVMVNPETGAVEGFAERDVIGDSLTVPVHAYWELTLNPATKKPWTALELVLAILNGYRAQDITTDEWFDWPGLLDDEEWGGLRVVADNKMIPNRVDWRGTDARKALSQMMQLARVRVGAWPDGKVYVFPLDEYEIEGYLPDDWSQRRVEGSGTLFVQDNSIQRPAGVRLYFQKEQEFRFRLVKSTDTSSKDIPGVINVVRLMQPETLDLGDGNSREYGAGTYVPVEKYMDAIGITDEWFRRLRFNPYLASFYSDQILGEGPKPSSAAERRIGSLVSDYNQLFMLVDEWRKRLVDIRAETAAMLDTISGKRQPSPVWAYFFTVRRARCVPNGAVGEYSDLYQNSKYANSNGLPSVGENPDPLVATVEDPVLGVFRLRPGQDMKGIALGFEIGEIEGRDGGGLPDVTITENAYNLTNCALADDFRMCITMTMICGDPNNTSQLHMIEHTPGSVGAKPGSGPIVEKLVEDETARFDWEGTLLNREMLTARAYAEAQHIYRTWRDRWTGTATFAGLADIEAWGPVKEVLWQLVPTSEGSAVLTTIDCTEPPPVKSVEHLMPAELRHAMNRMLPPQS